MEIQIYLDVRFLYDPWLVGEYLVDVIQGLNLEWDMFQAFQPFRVSSQVSETCLTKTD